MKTIKMKCQNCDGLLEMDSDKEIIFCPYCGMKTLMVQDNEVKIAKINAEADVSKNVKIEEAHSKVEIEKAKIENRRQIIDAALAILYLIVISVVSMLYG